MEIVLLGTGAAWPDAYRSAPAFLIKHGNTKFLVDCGGGVCHQLMKAGIPPSALDHILLTHTHIDHCVEFPSLVFGAYLTGKEGSFHLFGPSGTQHFATSIFDDTYDFAKPMMMKLRNKEISVVTQEVAEGPVLHSEGLSVEATSVQHGCPSLAYKFSSNGHTVVLSGDSQPCDNLSKLAEGADLLIIECSFPEETGPKPGHCIPSQVADIATEAGVKSLVLIHLFPNCRGKEESMLDVIRGKFQGPVEIGYDLQSLSIG